MNIILYTIVIFTLLTFQSCNSPSNSDDNNTYDPHDYTVEPVEYACGYWASHSPNQEVALIDILFYRSPIHEQPDRATDEEIERAESCGGIVVHEFNVPMARIILPVDSLSGVFPIIFARGVEDADIFKLDLIVGFEMPFTIEDQAFLDSLGVEILYVSTSSLMINALVPDMVIPALRDHETISSIGVNSYGCLSNDQPNFQSTGREK